MPDYSSGLTNPSSESLAANYKNTCEEIKYVTIHFKCNNFEHIQQFYIGVYDWSHSCLLYSYPFFGQITSFRSQDFAVKWDFRHMVWAL